MSAARLALSCGELQRGAPRGGSCQPERHAQRKSLGPEAGSRILEEKLPKGGLACSTWWKCQMGTRPARETLPGCPGWLLASGGLRREQLRNEGLRLRRPSNRHTRQFSSSWPLCILGQKLPIWRRPPPSDLPSTRTPLRRHPVRPRFAPRGPGQHQRTGVAAPAGPLAGRLSLWHGYTYEPSATGGLSRALGKGKPAATTEGWQPQGGARAS